HWWTALVGGHRWVALVGTGGWAQVGGTAGHIVAQLLGTGGGTAGHRWGHCWERYQLAGVTAGQSRALIISALMIGADPRSDNCRFSAVNLTI
ncbi:unnamed protein product, partial [Staurois parvus]